MTFDQPIPIREIANQINAEIIGNPNTVARGINEIHQVRPGDITFVDVKKYFEKSLSSAATFVILNERTEAPEGKTLLLCADPFTAYNNLVLTHRPYLALQNSISPLAEIHPSAIIEPNVVIGPYVKIGANSHIMANVTIAEHTIIGEEVIVQPGAIIGTEAFYFKRNAEGFQKWRSGGRVILEDRVDVGAGCTINKGVSGDTHIGEGTKLDSQVHIGHDVVIGKRCLFAAQVGIGGNCVVGDEVILYGQVGIAQNLNIGNKVVVLAKSGVSKDLEEGKTYFGYPAQEARRAYQELAILRKMRDER
ncbi:MAG TPA: UDP-3-O-(3-hydroxymyristoyl)glucosamine N-acyltransferase [Haliscomenobacter sp.]|uniref:UDP-3-O-(3-hydroxymyristoyl)glucosamine N-acyltransferase n=1 Tax=Haliscomenobacter sp. TaxID=2717303 RepID=UPI002BCD35C6|nr:UDP-3-O-(3-hydroxymyristoyl)glucosamine N-acyltransferase [Haliscomenobacter sp.]HOY16545.1 UDP-3-O-(3-hydroxymyristoyl)glucosamine N-acyltransferase [Haliscomenobacter sp.]HPH21385.1 UDP-3-O-(3-hydroxymyristoyl)glucosamine N-acyltransferase [Haliscomenobacter sp.]